VTYFTTVVDDDGKVQHWPDIYALDARVASALGAPAGSMVTGAVTSSSATEPGDPVVRPKARPRQKTQESSNPFAGLFGN
jgi:hypothetical protein